MNPCPLIVLWFHATGPTFKWGEWDVVVMINEIILFCGFSYFNHINLALIRFYWNLQTYDHLQGHMKWFCWNRKGVLAWGPSLLYSKQQQRDVNKHLSSELLVAVRKPWNSSSCPQREHGFSFKSIHKRSLKSTSWGYTFCCLKQRPGFNRGPAWRLKINALVIAGNFRTAQRFRQV